jgi:archaellum component FlaC
MGILDSALSASHSFSGRVSGIDSKLQDAKQESAKGLDELAKSIRAEVMKIPMIMSAGASKLQNDFRLASSDLENNILKLKIIIARIKN